MNAFGFSVLIFVLFICFSFHGEGTASSSSGRGLEQLKSDVTMTVKSRKIKDSGITASTDKEDEPGNIDLEDYRPIDPVPSSKASIRPGPIQHGTPLMPYIPKPSPPPSRSKHGVFP